MIGFTSLLDYYILLEAYRNKVKLQNATVEAIAVLINNPSGPCRKRIRQYIKKGVFVRSNYDMIAGKTREVYSFNEEAWEKCFYNLTIVRCAISHIINKTGGKNWTFMYSPYSREELNEILAEFRLNG